MLFIQWSDSHYDLNSVKHIYIYFSHIITHCTLFSVLYSQVKRRSCVDIPSLPCWQARCTATSTILICSTRCPVSPVKCLILSRNSCPLSSWRNADMVCLLCMRGCVVSIHMCAWRVSRGSAGVWWGGHATWDVEYIFLCLHHCGAKDHHAVCAVFLIVLSLCMYSSGVISQYAAW